MPRSPDTTAVHAGRADFRRLQVHAPPIDLSTTYPLEDLAAATQSVDAMTEGGPPLGNPVYGRCHNPTVARFETAVAELEGAEEAVAFGSGMAATAACLMVAKTRGSHVVGIRPVYGGTDNILTSGVLGLEVTWSSPEAVGQAIRNDTALVVLETPTNPTLRLIDIADVVRQAGSVPVVVDSTFATPVLQRPIDLGATLVLHSGTKFLGGHSDVMAGVVATNAEWAGELRVMRMVTGGLLHPFGGFLLHRGLQTLPVRVRAAQATAADLAHRLRDHPSVERVYFPGLPDNDPQKLVGSQQRGPGSLLSFVVRGGLEAATAVMNHVQLITPAVSLGSVDTLIQHPAGLTHRILEDEVRTSTGIAWSLLRVSVGLEDVEDLWADLAQALEQASSF